MYIYIYIYVEWTCEWDTSKEPEFDRTIGGRRPLPAKSCAQGNSKDGLRRRRNSNSSSLNNNSSKRNGNTTRAGMGGTGMDWNMLRHWLNGHLA